MNISMIVAMDKNRLIGKEDGMPWSIKKDLQWFQAHTVGKTVVMGRKTWESIGSKPLPNRKNFVMSRSNELFDGATRISEAEEIFAYSAMHQGEVMIIGGAEIYNRFNSSASKLYITEINGEYTGDTYFPEYAPEFKTVSTWSDKDNKYSWKWKVLVNENRLLE